MDWGKILLLCSLGLGGFGLGWFILSCCVVASRSDRAMRKAVFGQVEKDAGYDIGKLAQEQREA